MSVATILQNIIVAALGVDEDEVTPDASFVDDLGADSLQLVEIVMAMEEAFGIEIPDEDAEGIETVREAVAYLEAAAAGTLPAPEDAAQPGDPQAAPVVEQPSPSPAQPEVEPDDDDDGTVYAVIVNDEETYAIWPADREVPNGWAQIGPTGTRGECLAYIAEVGGDLRPQSLRPKLPGG